VTGDPVGEALVHGLWVGCVVGAALAFMLLLCAYVMVLSDPHEEDDE
jgi:hypothetical protein